MLLLSHPTGGQPVRHAALALQEAGLLGELWTCLTAPSERRLRRLAASWSARQRARRSFPPELDGRLRAIPPRELFRLFAPRMEWRRLLGHEPARLHSTALYRALDRHASGRLNSGIFDGVYAYEDGAAHLFGAACDRGLARLYDLPHGYWRSLHHMLEEECQLAPEWAPAAQGDWIAAPAAEHRDAELALAELVFVPSTHALSTLDLARDFHGTAVIVPYGVASVDPPRPRGSRRSRTLRVLFVGALTTRKGLRYLFHACRQLGSGVDLTLIGSRPPRPCAALDAELARHRWIPACGPERVQDEMRRHDVLVLPSLAEGFGLPLLEAMATGLPIITTPNTAGPDLIRSGDEGYLVPIRDADAIAEKLDLLRREPERGRAMGEAARARAAAASWESYRHNLAACAASVLASR